MNFLIILNASNEYFCIMSGITYWLNIDKAKSKCTLHTDNCQFTELARTGSKWKDFGSIGQWGGWISFETREEALVAYTNKYHYYGDLRVGCACLKRKELRKGYKEKIKPEEDENMSKFQSTFLNEYSDQKESNVQCIRRVIDDPNVLLHFYQHDHIHKIETIANLSKIVEQGTKTLTEIFFEALFNFTEPEDYKIEPEHPQEALRFYLNETLENWLELYELQEAHSEWVVPFGAMITYDEKEIIVEKYRREQPKCPLCGGDYELREEGFFCVTCGN